MGGVGAVGLAGCQGGGRGQSTEIGDGVDDPTGANTNTGTPIPEDLPFVEGQKFRNTVALNPKNVTFFWPWFNWVAYDTVYHGTQGGLSSERGACSHATAAVDTV